MHIADIIKRSESDDYLKQVVDRDDAKAVYHYVRRETNTCVEKSTNNLPEEDRSLLMWKSPSRTYQKKTEVLVLPITLLEH